LWGGQGGWGLGRGESEKNKFKDTSSSAASMLRWERYIKEKVAKNAAQKVSQTPSCKLLGEQELRKPGRILKSTESLPTGLGKFIHKALGKS